MTSDDVTVQVQQLQHQTEILTRRLIVARTALETISNGECAPEISKTAREALSIANREVCVRNWLLGIMFMQGLLGDWQGTELDSPCIESLQLFLLMVFNSIQRRLLRAAERGI